MIKIQMWADFECPYSYFQTIVLEKLQAMHQGRLEIVWRAFELIPAQGDTPPPKSYLDNLEVAKSEPIVVEENLQLLTPKLLTDTWLAQEAVYFANSQGSSLKLARALFDAFFLKGSDISSEELVMDIASQEGIDTQLLRQSIDNGELTKHVMVDEQEFKAYGFQGLPAMLIGGKNSSPRSFMPLTGYKNFDELSGIIRGLTL